MIEHYEFGKIIINGKKYNRDLILYPNKINDSWWRKEGHRLSIEDIEEIINEKPEVLIIGTGYMGIMEVPEKVIEYVKSNGIEIIIAKTSEACKKYNELYKSKKVCAALHLTC